MVRRYGWIRLCIREQRYGIEMCIRDSGGFGMVEDSADSLMAAIGGVIAPIFAPLGFGEWQPVAASISGFTAKEAIVSTMGVLANVAGDTEDAVNVAAGVASWFPTGIRCV